MVIGTCFNWRSITYVQSDLSLRNFILMILIVYTREFLATGYKQADYQWVDDLGSFVDWYTKQGDKLVYSLNGKKRTLTQYGFVKTEQSPAQILQVTNKELGIHIEILNIVSEDGVLFNRVCHSSELLCNCFLLKCAVK